MRLELPVVGGFRARFPKPPRLLPTKPTAAAKTTAKLSANVGSQSVSKNNKHAIDTATNKDQPKLYLELTSGGAPLT